MHPIYPTAELSVVIKNVELSFGLFAIGSIMTIVNSVADAFDDTEL